MGRISWFGGVVVVVRCSCHNIKVFAIVGTLGVVVHRGA